jgi:threonine/homoserine/homoserine lactone efflux protein
MSIIEIIAFFGIMVSLAAVPSTSTALVVTRSATSGVRNGVAVAAGIVLGDLVFIILAMFGLSVVAETMGYLFMAIKYLGAIYLVWFGFSLFMTKPRTKISVSATKEKGSLITSFLAGFVLTLGDIKAIIFYISLFPVFIDLAALRAADVLVIMLVTVTSVGGVKIVYALLARKIAALAKGLRFESAARKTAGAFMVGAGSYIIAKA